MMREIKQGRGEVNEGREGKVEKEWPRGMRQGDGKVTWNGMKKRGRRSKTKGEGNGFE